MTEKIVKKGPAGISEYEIENTKNIRRKMKM